MNRLDMRTSEHAQAIVEGLYRDMERRIVSSPPGICPVDLAQNFLNLCHAQICGKCVPCRIGLAQISSMMSKVLDGETDESTIDLIEETAKTIVQTADCAIGISAAQLVLNGVRGFRDDYLEHVLHHRCLGSLSQPVPCVALCPAGVDIPGYIALINEERSDDAVQLIRKDNPFPVTCAYVCEHPCEARCRRNMIDSPLNIRGLKRYAVDHASPVTVQKKNDPTGKRVAIIGGGPAGLSAAYYLALMGHAVTVYEQRAQLGGMLRYGIPSYRLPREQLDADIAYILSAGVEVKTGVCIGEDLTMDQLMADYDSVYLSIGAHGDKRTGIEGETAEGVVSAVRILRSIGDHQPPDFSGLEVVVIGGGNVAMDATRSAIRLGAKKATCVYRRRKEDMPALADEVEGAIAEGAELKTLLAPAHIETDEYGHAKALWAKPQITGPIGMDGRPMPVPAAGPEVRVPADLIVLAVGQDVVAKNFVSAGVELKKNGTISAESTGKLTGQKNVFAGGDCVTGPATVIKAIAAGKVAAANIDQSLGFHHMISTDVQVPNPRLQGYPPTGRVQLTEREASERRQDFRCIECGMTGEEAQQESLRCLRCDHFGYGIFKGGRIERW